MYNFAPILSHFCCNIACHSSLFKNIQSQVSVPFGVVKTKPPCTSSGQCPLVGMEDGGGGPDFRLRSHESNLFSLHLGERRVKGLSLVLEDHASRTMQKKLYLRCPKLLKEHEPFEDLPLCFGLKSGGPTFVPY